MRPLTAEKARCPYFRGVHEEHFTVGAGLEAGIPSHLLRGRRFERPYWGIRSLSELDGSVESRAAAFLPRMPARGFYFGATAGALWGIPLPRRWSDTTIHIGVAAGARRIDCTGVIPHQVTISPPDLTILRGMPVTAPARTWCDLAASGLRRSELVAAGDRLLFHRDPLATERDIRAALVRYEGRRGSRLLRDALPILTDRSESAPESELRVAIIDARLPTPEVNADILDVRGRFVARCDLVWRLHRVIVEYEGDHHRTDRAQWQRDLERFTRLQELGWTVIRATAADYRDPTRLIARLARILLP